MSAVTYNITNPSDDTIISSGLRLSAGQTLKNQTISEAQLSTYRKAGFIITQYAEPASNTGSGLTEWIQGKTFAVDAVIAYNGQLYICTTAHTSSSQFDPSKWRVLISAGRLIALAVVGTILKQKFTDEPDSAYRNILDFSTLLTDINSTLGSHSSQITNLQTLITANSNAISSFNSQIMALDTAIDARESEINSVRSALNALSMSLGSAATKNVGTVANTVAAGDDARILAALTNNSIIDVDGTSKSLIDWLRVINSTAGSVTPSDLTALENKLVNGASSSYDTFKELQIAIEDILSSVSTINTTLSNKSNVGHTHLAAEISDSTADGRNILRSTFSSMRTSLSLVIGTDVQAYNANLADISSLTTQTYGRSLLTASNATSAQTILNLGSAATLGAGVANGVATLDSTAKIPVAQVPDLDAAKVTTGVFDISRIPVIPSQKQEISTGDLTALTTTQQNNIGKGTIVTTVDGGRYVYTGTGSKTVEASYIKLADITPTIGSVEGLQTALDDKISQSTFNTLVTQVNALQTTVNALNAAKIKQTISEFYASKGNLSIGQTTFTTDDPYTPGKDNVLVIINGFPVLTQDFTATNGTQIVLGQGVTSADDEVKIISLKIG